MTICLSLTEQVANAMSTEDPMFAEMFEWQDRLEMAQVAIAIAIDAAAKVIEKHPARPHQWEDIAAAIRALAEDKP